MTGTCCFNLTNMFLNISRRALARLPNPSLWRAWCGGWCGGPGVVALGSVWLAWHMIALDWPGTWLHSRYEYVSPVHSLVGRSSYSQLYISVSAVSDSSPGISVVVGWIVVVLEIVLNETGRTGPGFCVNTHQKGPALGPLVRGDEVAGAAVVTVRTGSISKPAGKLYCAQYQKTSQNLQMNRSFIRLYFVATTGLENSSQKFFGWKKCCCVFSFYNKNIG